VYDRGIYVIDGIDELILIPLNNCNFHLSYSKRIDYESVQISKHS